VRSQDGQAQASEGQASEGQASEGQASEGQDGAPEGPRKVESQEGAKRQVNPAREPMDFLVQPNVAATVSRAYLLRRARFAGTFFPFLRALDRPIAIACLRFFTLPALPPGPLLAVPRL